MLAEPDLVEALLIGGADHVEILEQQRVVAPLEVVNGVHEHAEAHNVPPFYCPVVAICLSAPGISSASDRRMPVKHRRVEVEGSARDALRPKPTRPSSPIISATARSRLVFVPSSRRTPRVAHSPAPGQSSTSLWSSPAAPGQPITLFRSETAAGASLTNSQSTLRERAPGVESSIRIWCSRRSGLMREHRRASAPWVLPRSRGNC